MIDLQDEAQKLSSFSIHIEWFIIFQKFCGVQQTKLCHRYLLISDV